MVKIIIFLLGIVFTCINCFAQDTVSLNREKQQTHQRDGRFIVRAGIGGQGIVSIIFPRDVNAYTKDFYKSLEDYFTEFGYFPTSSMNVPPIFIGYGFSVKGDLRLLNAFQIEPWWDKFYAFPLKMNVDFYYLDYYSNHNERLTATYEFKPTYDEKGLSLIFVPGSKRKSAFLTLGIGVGILNGAFIIKTNGTHTRNDTITILSKTETFSGKTFGYHMVLGLTFVPWNYLELELLATGRYARIPEIKNADGDVFINEFNGNKPVSLDFTGFDIRFGLRFIFP